MVLVSIASSVWMEGHQRLPRRLDRTHIEDVKDPVEIQVPGSNRLFIVLGMKESRDSVPSTLLEKLPLNLAHSPAIE